MDCKIISNNILFYLDQELKGEELIKFAAHLNECTECKQLYDHISSTYQVITQENKIMVNPFFYHKLITKLESIEENKAINIFTTVLKPIAVAASIALGIFIGNGELDLLNIPDNEIDLASESFTPVLPADYSVWISMNEDYGSED